MTFSNVTVFKQVKQIVSPSSFNKVADKVSSGGAFSPNTLENIAIMRSSLDNSWENAFIIRYRALMQNRLNRVREQLQAAYKALLEQSSVQHIRDNGLNASNSSVTDVDGNMLPGAANAFKGLTYYDNAATFDSDDVGGGSNRDGVPSFNVTDSGVVVASNNSGIGGSDDMTYEMRKLYVNGPALQVINDMKVTMRTEEVPTKKPNYDIPTPFGDIPFDSLGDLLGSKPFLGGMKVAEYSTEVRTGSFWTSVNYLYNFAPRELSYKYVTAYSTTTEEAGTRTIGTQQATLFDQQLVDARDSGEGTDYEDSSGLGQTSLPTYNANNNQPPVGSRIKWVSSNPSDGYITERSPVFGNDSRFIYRRQVDNFTEFLDTGTFMNDPNDAADNRMFRRFDDEVFSSTDFQSYYVPITIDGDGTGSTPHTRTGKVENVVYSPNEFVGKSLGDSLKFKFEHDGVAAADLNQDGEINTADEHSVKAAFINHYIVQTQSVKLNNYNSSDSYGTIYAEQVERERSPGVDGSAEHVVNDEQDDETGEGDNNIEVFIEQHDNDQDGDYNGNPDVDLNEKLLLAGSGKISSSFTADFVKREHQIQSFNGQDVATNASEVRMSTFNDSKPVILGELEGFGRAEAMSKGIATDPWEEANDATQLSQPAAAALAKKIAMEANAADSMVDTDWHYTEYTTQPFWIGFRNITSIDYNGRANMTATVTADEGDTVGPFSLNNNQVQVDNASFFQTGMWVDINGTSYEITNVDSTLKILTFATNHTPGTGANVGDTVTAVAQQIRYNPAIHDGTNFQNIDVAFRKSIHLDRGDIYDGDATTDPGAANATNTVAMEGLKYNFKDAFVTIDASNITGNIGLIVNGKLVGNYAPGATVNLAGYLQAGDNVISAQMSMSTGGTEFSLTAGAGNTPEVNSWINESLSTNRNLNRDSAISHLNPGSVPLSTWQAKLMTNLASNSNDYKELGSIYTVTNVKDSNAFTTILSEIMNDTRYRDIFDLGLWNTLTGKSMKIQGSISAPTGGSIVGTVDIEYNPIDKKFTMVQTKWDAFSGG